MIKKHPFTAYTLSEIVIVMLIISVVVAVTIGVTKKKLESTVSYTYYSAYESLKDVSRALLTDFRAQDEDYMSDLQSSRFAYVNHNANNYLNLFNNFVSQPAFAIDYGLDHDINDGYNQSNCEGANCVKVPETGGGGAQVDEIPNIHTCTALQKKLCMLQGGTFDDSTCECEYPDDPDPNPDPNPEPNPEPVCSAEDTPPACDQQCVDGQWQLIPNFSRECSDESQMWNEDTCACEYVPRTLPRNGKNFCEMIEQRVNTRPADEYCNGSSITSSTTDFKDKTPDIVLRNGMRLYNVRTGFKKIDELQGNKSGFTIKQSNASASLNDNLINSGSSSMIDKIQGGTQSGVQKLNKTSSANFSYLPVELFMRKPLSIFPILSGLWGAQPVFAIDGVAIGGVDCSSSGVCGSGTVKVTVDGSACGCMPSNITNTETQLPSVLEELFPAGSINSITSKACYNKSNFKSCNGIINMLNCSCIPYDDEPDNPEPTPEPSCSAAEKTSCLAQGSDYSFNDETCECIEPEPTPTPTPGPNPPSCSDSEKTSCLAKGINYYFDTLTCECHQKSAPGVGQAEQLFTDVDTGEYGYLVYVDIDGEKGSSKLWEDVYPFYMTLSGQVVPVYNTSNGNDFGGNSNNYLQTSIQYEKINAQGRRSITWLAKSVSFQQGACQSGFLNSSTPYCKGISTLPECANPAPGTKCSLKTVKPIKFL